MRKMNWVLTVTTIGIFLVQIAHSLEQLDWKTESDFKNAEPVVHRKARWLEENPLADSWGDSLRYVLEWAHQVPYVTLGTDAEYEKKSIELTKGYVTGRISSMLLVGYAKYVTDPGFKNVSKREMAKAGIESMYVYYKYLQKKKPTFKVPFLEEIKEAIRKNKLDELIEEQVEE